LLHSSAWPFLPQVWKPATNNLDSSSESSPLERMTLSVPNTNRAAAKIAQGLIAGAFFLLYVMLYWRGLDFGRPIIENFDEPAISEQALWNASHGWLTPLQEYTYGSLPIFVQCGVQSLLHAYNNAFGAYRDADNHPIRKNLADIATEPLDRDRFCFFFAGRATVACCAGVYFWLIYMFCMRLLGSRPLSCLCVLAVMVDPVTVEQGHYSLPNIPAALLALAVVYCSVVFIENGRLRVLYLGAVLAGLAIATKITVLWAFSAVAAAAVVRLRQRSIPHLPLLLCVCACTFVAGEPFAALDARGYFGAIAHEARAYSQRDVAVDSRDLQSDIFGSGTVRAYANKWPVLCPWLYGFRLSPLFFAGSLAGLIFLPFMTRWRGLVALAFPVLIFVFSSLLSKVRIVNFLPIVPFCALGFGIACSKLLQWGGARFRIPKFLGIVLLAVVALAAPFEKSSGIVRQFTTKDPYQTALEWIEKHLPRNARILAEPAFNTVFPFINDGLDVRSEYVFLWKPYTEFLDRDYVMALSPGALDRFPWVLRFFASWDKEFPPIEAFRQMRTLNEKRLTLLRHVTPEECGYVRRAEFVLSANDVDIYAVPKLDVLRIPLSDGLEKGKSYCSLRSHCPVDAFAQLPPGRYDVFVNTSRPYDSPPIRVLPLAVRIDDQEAYRLDLVDYRYYYFFTRDMEYIYNLDAPPDNSLKEVNQDQFVTTIEVGEPRAVRLHIEIAPPFQNSDAAVSIHSVAFAPTVGEIIRGNAITPSPVRAEH